jgi:hypothetical protein
MEEMLNQVNACACLGPRDGEPMCMCMMIQAGLRTQEDYEWSEEDKQKLNEALRQMGWK